MVRRRSNGYSNNHGAQINQKIDDDWHSIVLAAGKELMLELPFIPLFVVLCMTWRLPFLWIRMRENPKNLRWIIGMEYAYLAWDVFFFGELAILLPFTLWYLPNTLYELVQVDFTEERSYNECKKIVVANIGKAMSPIRTRWQRLKTWLSWHIPCPPPVQPQPQGDPFVFWWIQKVFRWRAADLNSELNVLYAQGLSDYNLAVSKTQIIRRYEDYVGLDISLAFSLIMIMIAFWRIPSFIYHMRHAVFLNVQGWYKIHHVAFLQVEQIVPDLCHIPLLLMLLLFFWRVPQFVAKVWTCPYTNLTGPRETLRNYVKLGLLDLVCGLIILLIIITVYRLPSLISALRAKPTEKSWQEVVFQEFVPETEIEFIHKLERKWEEEDNNNNNSSSSSLLPSRRNQTRTPSPARGRKSPARRRAVEEEEEEELEERPTRRASSRKSPSRKSPARRRAVVEEEEEPEERPTRRASSRKSKSPARYRS